MRLPMDDCVRERGEDAMKNKAVLIVNPSSGKEQAKANEEEAVKELKKVYEEVEVKETKGAGDAEGFAKEASLEEVSLVVSMGGDGTVHEVVNGLSDHKVRPALGIIPLGTVNDLARALKILWILKKPSRCFPEESSGPSMLQRLETGTLPVGLRWEEFRRVSIR